MSLSNKSGSQNYEPQQDQNRKENPKLTKEVLLRLFGIDPKEPPELWQERGQSGEGNKKGTIPLTNQTLKTD